MDLKLFFTWYGFDWKMSFTTKMEWQTIFGFYYIFIVEVDFNLFKCVQSNAMEEQN